MGDLDRALLDLDLAGVGGCELGPSEKGSDIELVRLDLDLGRDEGGCELDLADENCLGATDVGGVAELALERDLLFAETEGDSGSG